jgi:hypothetical protein
VAVLEREAKERGEIPLEELGSALYALAALVETDSLVDWNDDPRRSQANVVAVLDRAAAVHESSRPALLTSCN